MGSGLGQKCGRSKRPAPTVFSVGSCPREKPRSGLPLASTKRDEGTPGTSKLLVYRHALRRYALPPWEKYALNQLVYVGDEFQNVITASHDGTSDFNVIDRLRDCMLMLIVSAQAFESLIPPQTKEQAEVLALNLKNLVMYRAASETDALRCANALGKHWVERATRTVHPDHTARTTAVQL